MQTLSAPMPDRLERSFFERPTLVVARDLLGRTLVRSVGRECLGGRIVEVEAYVGEEDTACHASSGRTPRNAVMYGPPGFAYVYFTYGMHWMLNVVTEREGFPAAVLLRAIEPEIGLQAIRRRRRGRSDNELTSGPARLCQALGITGAQNGADLVAGSELYLEAGEPVDPGDVVQTPRIGIAYAEPKDRDAPWRFLVRTSHYASQAHRAGRLPR